MSTTTSELRVSAASTLSAASVPAQAAAGDTADVELQCYDGAAVLADLSPWQGLYTEVYQSDLNHADHTDPPLMSRLARHAERTGFTLVAAHNHGRPAGFVYGYTLPSDTCWWDGLTPTPDTDLIEERPGRTVGICEGLMLPRWRGLGLAMRLYLTLLAGRTEERASALIAHDNALMLMLASTHGAVHVGDLDPFPGWRRHAAYIRPLRPPAPAAEPSA